MIGYREPCIGEQCKFNHPPNREAVARGSAPIRPGEADCKYFMQVI